MVASVYLPKVQKTVKLGRIRPKSSPQVLKFCNYLRVGAVPPPAKVDYYTKALASIKRVYLNDRYGDCVIAGKYHAEGVWSANESGTAVLGSDQEVYQSYQTICGPGDNGCNITDVLDYYKAHGLPFSGQTKKIDGYVAIDTTNKLEVQTALYLFGALTIGINLPGAWADNAKDGAVWDVTTSGVVGGHDVTIVGYDDKGVQIATWGMVVTITWAALATTQHVEEGYALLAPDWYSNSNVAPCGVNAAELVSDLAKFGGGSIPPIPDPAPPLPPLPPTPPVPPPAPAPSGVWAMILAFVQRLLHLFGNSGPSRAPTHPSEVGSAFGLNSAATFTSIDWQGIVAWVKALLKQYGPVILPQLQVWVNALPVGPYVKLALIALIELLSKELQA